MPALTYICLCDLSYGHINLVTINLTVKVMMMMADKPAKLFYNRRYNRRRDCLGVMRPSYECHAKIT